MSLSDSTASQRHGQTDTDSSAPAVKHISKAHVRSILLHSLQNHSLYLVNSLLDALFLQEADASMSILVHRAAALDWWLSEPQGYEDTSRSTIHYPTGLEADLIHDHDLQRLLHLLVNIVLAKSPAQAVVPAQSMLRKGTARFISRMIQIGHKCITPVGLKSAAIGINTVYGCLHLIILLWNIIKENISFVIHLLQCALLAIAAHKNLTLLIASLLVFGTVYLWVLVDGIKAADAARQGFYIP